MSNLLITFGSFGYDVFFDFLFAIITLFVSFNSFKIYNLSKNKQIKLFGFGFLFLSLAYLIEFLIHFFVISVISENFCDVSQLNNLNYFSLIGSYINILFFMIGLIILVHMTLKKNSVKSISLFSFLTLFILLFGVNVFFVFYVVASLILLYISIYYYKNYLKHKMKKTLLVLIAFVFLFLSHIHFILSVNHALFYSIGHFFELIAYLLILLNLIIVLKND